MAHEPPAQQAPKNDEHAAALQETPALKKPDAAWQFSGLVR
jgi:hypothetical protein